MILVVPNVSNKNHGDTRSTLKSETAVDIDRIWWKTTSHRERVCPAFDVGARDEALFRRSDKGRVRIGVVNSPFVNDRGVFGSEFETSCFAGQHGSLFGAPRSARNARDHTL
jgi:hypothetical protein